MAVPTATACPMLKNTSTVDSDDLAAFSSFSITASRLGVDGAVSTPSITFSIIS